MRQVILAKRSPETLVAAMIKMQEKIFEIKNGDIMDNLEEQAAVENMVMKASCQLEQIVMDLSEDTLQLIKFCYHLRKADTEDKYSFEFLNGNVSPSVLVDMIISNKWDSNTNTMKPDSQFTLHIGPSSHIMVYEPIGGPPRIDKQAETN